MTKEVATATTIAGGFTIGDALVHGFVIERFDQVIKGRVDLRLEQGGAVKVDGQVAERLGTKQTLQAGQGARNIDQIEKGMGD